MTELVQALEKARSSVAHGWTKDREMRMVFGRRTVCAVGALADGAMLLGNGGLKDSILFNQEVEVFTEAIGEVWPNREWETIPEWNDEPERTKTEVLETFDRALKIAERDHSIAERDT